MQQLNLEPFADNGVHGLGYSYLAELLLKSRNTAFFGRYNNTVVSGSGVADKAEVLEHEKGVRIRMPDNLICSF